MPTPNIGKAAAEAAAARRAEEALPQPEVLGEIKFKGPGYQGFTHTEVDAATGEEIRHQIEIENGPPPWELEKGRKGSDARTFVDCPKEWELRWINPKSLDQYGWRGWEPVRHTDPRVKLKVPGMKGVDSMIRRGGGTSGDILAKMPRHWYEDKLRQREEYNARQTQASVDRLRGVQEDFARGKYGPNVRLDRAQHPTHTMIHPQDMKGETD